MLQLLILAILIFLFGTFNLLGIQKDLLVRHLTYFGIGVLFYSILRKKGLHFLRLNTFFFYWLSIILLIITYVIGFEVKGSQRWIDLYFFKFQSSEFLKIIFIVFMAEFFSRNRAHLKEFSFFLLSMFYFAVPALLVFKQPDLGNALVYAAIFFTMLMFSGIPKKFILYVALIGVVSLPIGWNFLKEYQKSRITTFFNPHIDQEGTSYNMTQALISVGSGTFTGKGLGLGTQSRLYFLPENETDFAFSSLIEQFGFVGGFAVISLFFIMAIILIKRITYYYYQQTVDGRFHMLVYIGFTAFFLFQAFVNMGMNLGILPIAGITLPFISYGGSSLITCLIALALLP